MAVYRAQISIPVDSELPKDRMIITPHFKVASPLANPQSLADDLAAAMSTWLRSPSYLVDVKLYDAEDPPPSAPKATKKVGSSQINSAAPRELALCLSYYADDNVPRRRGRLYIPFSWVYRANSNPSPPALRPQGADQTAIMGLATALKALGGVDVDWCVWSRIEHAAHSVTNYYVDDEWDIQRRRGGRPTSRVSGTGS